jgi:hypothetical protein
MIKFFRKIRQNLLMENKTGKYFKYAIGEIILVVVGILIALSINNWNENQKNQTKKTKLLKALKIEFISNQKQLDTVLYYDNIVLKSASKLMEFGPETSIDIVQDSLPYWLQNSAFRWTFDPLNGALRSGISSGEIHLIKNDSLSNLLFGWSDFVSDYKEGEIRTVEAVKASKSVIEKHIRLVDYKNTYSPALGKSKFNSNYQSLFNDPLYEDYLGERYLSMEDALGDLILVKKKNELILELLDKELNMH